MNAYNTLLPAGIAARSHAEITGLLGGLPLVAPGVVPAANGAPITPRCRHAAPTYTPGWPGAGIPQVRMFRGG